MRSLVLSKSLVLLKMVLSKHMVSLKKTAWVLSIVFLTLGMPQHSQAETLPSVDSPESKYMEEYRKKARLQADQNRYLVKSQINPKVPDSYNNKGIAPYLVGFSANTEPRMVHCEQIQASWNKLASGGYCTPDVSSQQLRLWKNICPDLQAPPKQASCKKPNILIYLLDDIGWGDFGPFGGGTSLGAASPNINRLANEGLLLTSTYAQPTCSPTRATIHTGQLPIHHGVLSPPMYGDPGGITPESVPLPQLLKKQGYTTTAVGKWHLGDGTENLPTVNGYDRFYGFLTVSDMYTEWRDPYYNPEVGRDEERTRYMQKVAFNHYLVHSEAGKKSDEQCKSLAEIVLPWEAEDQTTPTQGYTGPCAKADGHESSRISISQLDRVWAEYSADFIRKQKNSQEPWFLYHGTRGCHFDNYPREGFRRTSYARTDYTDCLVEMDAILGYLMQTLKETGQDEDTLIFFTSDNGPEQEIDPHGATPFRGGKGDTFEGGVRVPGIARWPGMIEPGRRSEGLFDLADLYTTALAFAGVDYASASENNKTLAQRYLYGIDQTSFLLNDEGASNRRSTLHWFVTDFSAVRMDEFKAYNRVSIPVSLHKGNVGGLSGITLDTSYVWLFNLQNDPKEEKNVFIRHLWNQNLFSSEFGRFMCVLKSFPPQLPDKPAKMVEIMNTIEMMDQNPEVCAAFDKNQKILQM